MTVQELIDALQCVEDKTRPVRVFETEHADDKKPYGAIREVATTAIGESETGRSVRIYHY